MISTLEALKMQLRQAIIQLEQAEKSLDKEEMMHDSFYWRLSNNRRTKLYDRC